MLIALEKMEVCDVGQARYAKGLWCPKMILRTQSFAANADSKLHLVTKSALPKSDRVPHTKRRMASYTTSVIPPATNMELLRSRPSPEKRLTVPRNA
jgi:hypothetical protein